MQRPPLAIIYQDSDLVVIDKPAGMHVHPPENPLLRVPREKICLYQLRSQIASYLYPVHRLDVGTSGLLLWALSSEMAGQMNALFQTGGVEKHYEAVVRGWPRTNHFEVDLPLHLDSTGEEAAALTQFEVLHHLELPFAVGKKFSTARYAWLKAKPKTGRYHQIRRHLNRISHPIIGDRAHGDSHHNRFFREQLGREGLCLRAVGLNFKHPRSNKEICLQAPALGQWVSLRELFTKSASTLDPIAKISDSL